MLLGVVGISMTEEAFVLQTCFLSQEKLRTEEAREIKDANNEVSAHPTPCTYLYARAGRGTLLAYPTAASGL
jgi:hypothetical protein